MGGEYVYIFTDIEDPFVVGVFCECLLDCVYCTVDISFSHEGDLQIRHDGGDIFLLCCFDSKLLCRRV